VKAPPTVSKSDPKETRLGSTLFGEIAKIDRGGEMKTRFIPSEASISMLLDA
jgi:hypothetical protein